jgi:CRISPR-associated protein Cas8b1/Cst1 subtype I-B
MIKLFIPEVKTKTLKTKTRGLWLNEQGHLYYDYLRQDVLNWDLNQANYKSRFYLYLNKIKISYNQEALFYNYNGKGFIYYNKDKIEILNKVIRFNIGKDRANLKGLIKKLLRDYNGLTIYTEPEGYLLEVYYK